MTPESTVDALYDRPDREKVLAARKMGIRTVHDLLYHLPSRYEGTDGVRTASTLVPGATVTLYGTVKGAEARKTWKTRRPVAEGYLEDGGGRVKIMWFSQPYMAKVAAKYPLVALSGRVGGTAEKPYLANPTVEPVSAIPEHSHDSLFGGAEQLFPVYPETKGVSSLWLREAVARAIRKGVHEALPDIVPEELLKKYSLPKLSTAVVWAHAPKKASDAEAARKRFAFEEVFTIQIAVAASRAKSERTDAPALAISREKAAAFVKDLPFPLTGAQERAIDACFTDFTKPHPMMRLLEGDVGSGKTAVAATLAYAVSEARLLGGRSTHLQVAYMVPTEILAKQHFRSFIAFFAKHRIPIALVTGKECYKFPSKVRGEEATRISRPQLAKWVAGGEIPVVIGTHALIQKSIVFKDLALAIIDEQHRFGKVARKKLARKDGKEPHLLSMTATPIPRTLALTIYGDLDLSVLDELPKGRKPVVTVALASAEREKAYERIRSELAAGRQAYIICPRIDEPDPAKELALQAKSAKAEAARLAKEVFPEYAVELLHGKMTPSEKEEAMGRFERNESQILVATSVVEVGVNVPNATVILIEGAERFGLSQLHQLRGRVIRSSHQAYCFALAESSGAQAVARLKALSSAKDGFELAEHDLAQRGSGELYGTRQWGVSDVAMEAIKNLKMVEAAREAAQAIVREDPELSGHPLIRKRAARLAETLYGE